MAALAIAGAAGSARAIEIYQIDGGTYTRIQVQWEIPTDSGPVINPPTSSGIDPTIVTQNPADPFDYEVCLATEWFNSDCNMTQTTAIWTAYAVLPPADGYVIVFTHDARTWDSYNESGPGGSMGIPCSGSGPGGGGSGGGAALSTARSAALASMVGGGGSCAGGYFDFISLNINQDAPYIHLVDGGYGGLSDPLVQPDPNGVPVVDEYAVSGLLPGKTWGFGGACWDDDLLEITRGRYALEFYGSSGSEYFLSVSVDTATTPTEDENLASWAVFNSLKICAGDFDADGYVEPEDLAAFNAAHMAGSLTADFNGDGVVDSADSTAFAAAHAGTCAKACPFKIADLNGDGNINDTDLQLFAVHRAAGTGEADMDRDGDDDDFDVWIFMSAYYGRCFCPADVNFDGIVDSTDQTLFADAYYNGERLADLNRDGEVHEDDVALFNSLLNGGCAPCRADFDGSGVVDVADIFAFLSAWFANDPSADFDGNSTIDVADIFAFLSAWFAGC